MMKSYDELLTIPTFEERFEYLKFSGTVGELTFGHMRYMVEAFYKSVEWLVVKRQVAIRDSFGGDYVCDLAISDRYIMGTVVAHHINPVTPQMLLERNPLLFDLNNIISSSHNTHMAIHYGDSNILIPSTVVERKPNDTCPWKK